VNTLAAHTHKKSADLQLVPVKIEHGAHKPAQVANLQHQYTPVSQHNARWTSDKAGLP
jgi:hypothetical protein